MRDDIPEEDMLPQRRFVLTTPSPRCDVAESSAAAAARAPRRQYDFIDAIKTGQGLIRSPGHDARTIARAADRAEDVGYVRALQTSEHRMMTSIKEVNLRVTTNLPGTGSRQESEIFPYISFMMLLPTRAEDDAVRQIMRTHVLKARAQIDTVEDADSSC
ncbi:hypothetical protein Tco_0882920 [Tanacetum coccineum]